MKKPTIFSKFQIKAFLIGVASFLILNAKAAIAQDPFRQANQRPISDTTEAAFEAMFITGNYQQASQILKTAPPEIDPLAYALMASLAYTEEEWETVKKAADKTRFYAQEIGDSDPLRRDLYLAVSYFLEGSYLFEVEGAFSVFKNLQKMLHYLELAEKHNPEDPELNLIKGYLDLILAVNLPFFEPEHAIARFEKYASPHYLVDRGLAIAYRDLEDYEKALVAVNKALAATPDNPEIHYLKGQILYNLAKETRRREQAEAAVKHFESAIVRSDQLPESISKPYEREHRLAQELFRKLTISN